MIALDQIVLSIILYEQKQNFQNVASTVNSAFNELVYNEILLFKNKFSVSS